MKKRKQYIIDKKFQKKTTFSIIGITSLIAAILIGLICLNLSFNNKRLSNVIEIQDNVVNTLVTYSQGKQLDEQKSAIKNITRFHYNNISTIKDIIKKNNWLIIIIIIISIGQSIILYFILIRKTHRISGPIYVLSKHMNEIINGQYPDIRPLRKEDELKKLYELFRQMVESLKKGDHDIS